MSDRSMHVRKSTALAGILSMMPGAGQIYVGHYVAGFTNILVIAGIISVLSSNSIRGFEPFFGLFLAFFWVFNIVDAVRKANLYNLRAVGENEEPVPTDSPLIGGVVLVVLGVLLTLEITFDVDLEFLEDIWPLFILAAGVYLIWRYRRAKAELTSGTGSDDGISGTGGIGRYVKDPVERREIASPPTPPSRPPASTSGAPGGDAPPAPPTHQTPDASSAS